MKPNLLEFLRFIIIGTGLLLLEVSIVTLLKSKGSIDPIWGRLVSLPISIGVGWFLNRTFTFKNHNRRFLFQAALYYILMSFSLLINYTIFAIGLYFLSESQFGIWISLVLGASSALFINYCAMKFLIFRKIIE